MPTVYPKSSITYDIIVGNQTVTPSYDPHCETDVSGGCAPVKVLSAEKLVQSGVGPAVNREIAELLQSSSGINEYLIEEDAWECIWTELIVNKKGLKTFIDREGFTEQSYNFSEEMLSEMLHELDRLIDKYSSPEWNTKQTAQALVTLLQEHRALVQTEHDEVVTGQRVLKDTDMLGPKERKKRKLEKLQKEMGGQKYDQEAEAQRVARRLNEDHYDEAMTGDAVHRKLSDMRPEDALHMKLLEMRMEKIKAQVFEDDAKWKAYEEERYHDVLQRNV